MMRKQRQKKRMAMALAAALLVNCGSLFGGFPLAGTALAAGQGVLSNTEETGIWTDAPSNAEAEETKVWTATPSNAEAEETEAWTATPSNAETEETEAWTATPSNAETEEAEVWTATPSNAETAGSIAGDGYARENGTWIFEAEDFYSEKEPTADGQAADLQPHTKIRIPLDQVEGFASGTYLIEAVYAGNSQALEASQGAETSRLTCPDVGFVWESRTAVLGDEVLHLSQDGALEVSADTDGRYGWVDQIRLTPIDGVLLKARDHVEPADKVTGDDGTCANMDPGVSLKIPVRGSLTGGLYELCLWTCGNERTYRVMVNGTEAGTYETTGTDFGNAHLHGDGWQGTLLLEDGDTLEIEAPEGSYGWIGAVILRRLPEQFYEKDEATGIVVEAEAGVLPQGTSLKVKQVSDKASDSWFEENGLRAVYYEIRLKRDGGGSLFGEEDAGGEISLEIPLPSGFSEDDGETDLYYIGSDGPERLFADQEGARLKVAIEPETDGTGVYAVTARDGVWHYEGEDYYDALADGGNAADFQSGKGEAIAVPLEKGSGFRSGTYNLLTRYSGGGDAPISVLVNGESRGSVTVSYLDWGTYGMGLASATLNLKPGDTVAIQAPEGQYQWIDWLEMRETGSFETEMDGVTASAPEGVLPLGTQLAVEPAEGGEEEAFVSQRFEKAEEIFLFRLNFYLEEPEWQVTPAGTVELSMEVDGAFDPEKFCLYSVQGSGQGMKLAKIPSEMEGSTLTFQASGETGVFALVGGVGYVPADYSESAIFDRLGGTPDLQETESAGFPVQVKSRRDGNRYLYEGEAYYKAQGSTATADLQPGSQMNIPLSDNPDFRSGTYRLSVRSNGNRQMFRVKVNHQEVGTINRLGTDFTMPAMTEDAMAGTLALKPSDILTIEAEGGSNYGWVDYVILEPAEGAEPAVKPEPADNTLSYQAVDYYDKTADGGAYADLQPGETITIPVSDNPEFTGGTYRIAVTSNGNRTTLLVKKNGEALGSVVRAAGNGFDRTDLTRDVLNRNVTLEPGDVITIEAPGTNPDEGPWGWVAAVELEQPPKASGTAKAEYRYDGEDYYQASLYSPAADLQAGDSLSVPLADDPDFTAGTYRLSVLSNGTRERFDVSVNGRPVGSIYKKAADYSDIDYSQDYLEGTLTLAPGDVLTLTGQEGDYYGWVNYILLEREDG